jgi:argonaute-like protein implicated in RNA metabolism and viral defense
MTYHQCYNYYGFGGPIKTPATAFYAQKIAKYAVDNYEIKHNQVSDQISKKLLNNLHFL